MITVKELIKILQQYPDDMPVVRDCGGDCGGYSDIVSSSLDSPDWDRTGVINVCESIKSSYGGNYWSKDDVDCFNHLPGGVDYEPDYFKALILR